MLIDREALMDARRKAIKTYENASIYNPNAIREGLKPLLDAVVDVPAVDPIHAAGACYCRECKHYGMWADGRSMFHCDRHECTMYENDFCSYGEKRDE